MQDNTKIQNLMQNAMTKIKDIIDVDTVVGTPISCLDGTTIIPITKVIVGFVAGGGEYSQNIPPKNAQKEYPFAGGSTAGFSISPIGFLVMKNGKTEFVTLDNKSTFDELVKLASDITKKVKWGCMKKNFINIFLCFLVMIMVYISCFVILPNKVQSVAQTDIGISAKGAVVIEANSGRVLVEKNKDEQLPMASTTKVMTALVALENTEDLDEVFATDNRAVGIEGTSIYLKKDEHLSMRNLLYGLMLASGNDAALAIAYRVGEGSLDKFVDLMNKKAEELNLHNTHFDNPHGLDSKTHYTSAYDLAVITAKAMENKDFTEIVKTKYAQIPSNIEGQNRFLRNKHKLLQQGMEGCEGVKTGFTDNARRCCVTSVFKNGMRLICVVLNCQNMFEESKMLLDNSFETYTYQSILKPNSYIDSVSVENGKIDSVKAYTKKGFSYPLKDSELNKINTKFSLPERVNAPIEKDTVIGEYKIYFNNDLIFTEKIYTIENVETKDYGQKIKDIIENWS